MRWFWIDHFTEFISGTRAVAIKTVSLSEDYLHDHVPGFPYMSGALVIEGFAQSGGLLVGESSGFQERVVLAKVARAEFHEIARPGDTLTLQTNVEDIRSTGGIITGTCHIGDRLLTEVELVFANLDDRFDGVDQFIPEEFLSMLRILRMYEVGRKPDGSPLDIPPHLLEAEELAERQMNG